MPFLNSALVNSTTSSTLMWSWNRAFFPSARLGSGGRSGSRFLGGRTCRPSGIGAGPAEAARAPGQGAGWGEDDIFPSLTLRRRRRGDHSEPLQSTILDSIYLCNPGDISSLPRLRLRVGSPPAPHLPSGELAVGRSTQSRGRDDRTHSNTGYNYSRVTAVKRLVRSTVGLGGGSSGVRGGRLAELALYTPAPSAFQTVTGKGGGRAADGAAVARMVAGSDD